MSSIISTSMFSGISISEESPYSQNGEPPCCQKVKNEHSDAQDAKGILEDENKRVTAAAEILNNKILESESPQQIEGFRVNPITPEKLTSNHDNFSEESSEKMDPQSAIFKSEIEKYRDKLAAFEEEYRKKHKYWGLGVDFGTMLAPFDYVNDNKGNILHVFSDEKYQTTAGRIKTFNTTFKWVNVTFPLFVNFWKFYLVNMLRNQFKEGIEHFDALKKQRPHSSKESQTKELAASESLLSSLEKRTDEIHFHLKKQHDDLKNLIGIKAAKFFSKISAFPLEFFGFIQNTTIRKSSFGVVKSLFGINLTNRSLEIKKDFEFQLQPSIHIDKMNEKPAQASEGRWSFFSSHQKKVNIDSITNIIDFMVELQKCSTLDEVLKGLKTKAVFDLDKKILNSLVKCTTLEQVQVKLIATLMFMKCEAFIKSLKESKNLDEVQQILKVQGIKTIEIPSSFVRWQSQMKDARFKQHLAQAFHSSIGKKPLYDGDSIERLLKKRKTERAENINKAAFTIIQEFFKECENKDIPAIVQYFKKNHIDFDCIQPNVDPNNPLPLPLKSKKEWLTCISSPAFCLSLAEQWVDYQETIAILADKAIRQSALSKIQVENKFLFFRWIEYHVEIALASIHLFFCWHQLTFRAIASILELFVTELGKFNIRGLGLLYLFYPLYPKLSFKLEGLIILLVEHFFAIKYKPNEYSLCAYKLGIQIRLVELMALSSYFLSIFQDLLLRLKIRLIENCIMRIENKPFKDEMRKIHLDEKYKETHSEYEKQIKYYRNRLSELRLLDAKLAISPQSKNVPSGGKFSDPIEAFVESLEDANFEYFPARIRESFHKNFGIELVNDKKSKVKKKMENFFSKGEINMTDHYQKNNRSYLRNKAG